MIHDELSALSSVTRPAGAFVIEFRKPIRGPICLGHSSHFGLGLFMPHIAGK